MASVSSDSWVLRHDDLEDGFAGGHSSQPLHSGFSSPTRLPPQVEATVGRAKGNCLWLGARGALPVLSFHLCDVRKCSKGLGLWPDFKIS